MTSVVASPVSQATRHQLLPPAPATSTQTLLAWPSVFSPFVLLKKPWIVVVVVVVVIANLTRKTIYFLYQGARSCLGG